MITMLILHSLVYLGVGSFAGFMAGLFGVGGGLIVVPGLIFIFQQLQLFPQHILMYVAIGSSLATMIITSQAAIRAHYKLGTILWWVFNKLWPGLIIGTIIGAIAASQIPTNDLKIFFALFLLFVAAKMFFDKEVERPEKFPPNWMTFLISFLVGVNSGLLGIGGGILIVPFSAYCGIPTRKIAAISNLSALSIAITGTVIFMITGFNETCNIPLTTGYIYWPAVFLVGITSSIMAPIGTKLNYSLPVKQLKYSFMILLVIIGLKMLF
ncbi:MAG: sulfite exporter TauE/SafE family protein [Legionella sp.]|uniref:sulfite exporter TauE/SafE family protein n=1 Tax=Legionella sp. TaxID=459 RepID=UPI0039E6B978